MTQHSLPPSEWPEDCEPLHSVLDTPSEAGCPVHPPPAPRSRGCCPHAQVSLDHHKALVRWVSRTHLAGGKPRHCVLPELGGRILNVSPQRHDKEMDTLPHLNTIQRKRVCKHHPVPHKYVQFLCQKTYKDHCNRRFDILMIFCISNIL